MKRRAARTRGATWHRALLAALLVSTAPALMAVPVPADHDASTVPVSLQASSIERAIDGAMGWLAAHPASLREDELVGMAEEVIFFYAMGIMADDTAERRRYQREIASRHGLIVPYNAGSLATRVYLHGEWGPLTYPPLAYIIGRSGLETTSYHAVIDDLVASHHGLYPPRIAMQLWIAVYLQRLGYTPPVDPELLLGRSALQQDPSSHALVDMLSDAAVDTRDPQEMRQLLYDLTHEIMVLTDFGALRPPFAMLMQIDHHSDVLNLAIGWATRAGAVDVLAELVYSLRLLEIEDSPSLDTALDLILRSQQADGSFGITNPDRRNGSRHGVLTCILALKSVMPGTGEAPGDL